MKKEFILFTEDIKVKTNNQKRQGKRRDLFREVNIRGKEKDYIILRDIFESLRQVSIKESVKR